MITGYEPFDDFKKNPSEEVAKLFNDINVGDFSVSSIILPLDYTKAFELTLKMIAEHKPNVILCSGQATRGAITIERVAVNAVNPQKEDNYGNIPESDVIEPDAPAAYFTNIDPHPLIGTLHEHNIPAEVSYHAGVYGCNWLIFRVMHMIQKTSLNTKATFIHIPPLPEQAIQKRSTSLPTMDLETTVLAFTKILEIL